MNIDLDEAQRNFGLSLARTLNNLWRDIRQSYAGDLDSDALYADVARSHEDRLDG